MRTEDRRGKEAGGCRPETAGALRRANQCGAPLGVGPACPRVTDHEPPVTPSGSRVTGHESRATDRATSDECRATIRCSNCVYARRPAGRWLRLILSRWMGLLFCTNHPDFPGDVIGVPPCSRCRNFRFRPPLERSEVPDQTGLLVCTIPLTQKKVALVAAVDYERVNQYRWCAGRVGNQWYAYRKHFGKTLRMHQFIMNPPKGMVVDHANGNGLDNRRENLRLCTKLENAWNKRRRKEEGAKSQYIGVYPCRRPPGKWCIKVMCNGEVTNLSPFDTPEEAARVRDRKALELHGEYAWLNFPEEREQRLREIEAERKRLDTDSHG